MMSILICSVSLFLQMKNLGCNPWVGFIRNCELRYWSQCIKVGLVDNAVSCPADGIAAKSISSVEKLRVLAK